MSQAHHEHRALTWMHGPFVDLVLIGFCWLPLYLVYAVTALSDASFACDAYNQRSCPATITGLIVLTLFINRLHRHYTLGFAYGDPSEFKRHRKIYLWTPAIAFALVVPCALYRAFDPGPTRSGLFVGYAFMTALSGVWQVYHTVLQKYGFLRIYSAKLRFGDARVEKHLFFSWLALVLAGSVHKYAPRAAEIIYSGPREIWFLANFSRFLAPLGLALLAPCAVYAAVVTISWSRIEYRNFTRACVPKLLFALSLAFLMASFMHSLLIGVLLLGFSHAFEYTVFVNVFALRKYKSVPNQTAFFNLWVNNVIPCNLVLTAIVYGLTLSFRMEWVRPWGVLIAYAVFTSTLHFLYDSLLWKVSNPDVRVVLLELRNP
ncbi:MAG: hypothetical protein HY074_16145 [Deltaproteobacteria bacterium]|nr:hypothetical protein [Deltaproteobacteria bacterium]